MGNYNFKTTVENKVKNMPGKTQNLAGGLAFELSDKIKLYDMVSTWLVGEPKFYNDSDDDKQTVKGW